LWFQYGSALFRIVASGDMVEVNARINSLLFMVGGSSGNVSSVILVPRR
jgi:hypothetical protein